MEVVVTEFAKVSDTAELLNVKPIALLKMIRKGEISALRLPGGSYRISTDALNDFLARHTTQRVQNDG